MIFRNVAQCLTLRQIATMNERTKRDLAWVGDAVLALFARNWLLAQTDVNPEDRIEQFISLTSNQFLSSFGEPTAMEAEIGKIYERDGYDAAAQFIEEKFLPVFKRQRRNKAQQGAKKKKKRTSKS